MVTREEDERNVPRGKVTFARVSELGYGDRMWQRTIKEIPCMDHKIGTFRGDQGEGTIERSSKILCPRLQVILETPKVGVGEVAEFYLIGQSAQPLITQVETIRL